MASMENDSQRAKRVCGEGLNETGAAADPFHTRCKATRIKENAWIETSANLRKAGLKLSVIRGRCIPR